MPFDRNPPPLSRLLRSVRVWSVLLLVGLAGTALWAEAPPAPDAATLFIREYRVEGSHKLPRDAVEEAVYPFLGPGRTRDDVEQARAALEKAYFGAGFQTVAVVIPEQQATSGVIRLQVVERPVGRLRVRGAVYSSPAQIKALAPSLAEGGVINFENVPHDIVALNQLPDRRVTPTLRAGAQPDTVDVDLEVQDKLPLHASVEVNNRRGPATTPLRVNASVSATNLWQAGHGAGLSYQLSPQNPDEVKVYSGYYLARFAGVPWLTLMAQGTKQDSNVSTLGDAAVTGRGETAGLRAMVSLPAGKDFSQTAGVGVDYKHYKDTVNLAATGSGTATVIATPITYYPLSATYAATLIRPKAVTEFNAGLNFALRDIGGKTAAFANTRYQADANYVVLHADLAQTRDLPGGFQLYGKLQAQVADQPLINHEQVSGGGLGTVRGYLEAEVVGDNAVFGSLELRSPSLLAWSKLKDSDWRLYVFYEGGRLSVNDPLPDQKSHFLLASYGFGSRVRLLDHFDGSVNASLPQYKQAQTKANDLRVTFQAGLDF